MAYDYYDIKHKFYPSPNMYFRWDISVMSNLTEFSSELRVLSQLEEAASVHIVSAALLVFKQPQYPSSQVKVLGQ